MFEKIKTIDEHIDDIIDHDYIQYPIQVNEINFEEKDIFQSKTKDIVGSLVSIQPCDKKYNNKIFLGIYLGELPLSIECDYNEKSNKLTTGFGFYNPAIFVFNFKKIIFGIESFWKIINSEEDLKDIDSEIKLFELLNYIKNIKQ